MTDYFVPEIAVRLDVKLRRRYAIPDGATEMQLALLRHRIESEMIEAAGDFIASAVVNGKYEVVGTGEIGADNGHAGHVFTLGEPSDA